MTKIELEREVRRLRSENRKLMQIIDRAMQTFAEQSKKESEIRWPVNPGPGKWPLSPPYEITCTDGFGKMGTMTNVEYQS